MTRFFILLIVMTLGLARAEAPKLFCEKTFTCRTLADAVNHYVGIGQDAAVKELNELACVEAAEAEANRGFNTRGFSVNERIGWVCRILFEPNTNSAPKATPKSDPQKRDPYLRAPKFGRLDVPEKFMPIARWPLYPVVLSGSTYFVISESYTLGNVAPEDPKHYIAYCVENGNFRTTSVTVTTNSAQILKDADALRKCPSWQAINWKDDGGYSYPMGEQWTWGFIQKQARLASK